MHGATSILDGLVIEIMILIIIIITNTKLHLKGFEEVEELTYFIH